MKGAFRRGSFDVTSVLKPGQNNVLAVRISPPPHPGIPQEQSILGGPGENGGAMVLDGPTFVATEGWDWIPGVRDRNSGIWQPVTLRITHALKLGDAQVVTTFKNHDTSQRRHRHRRPGHESLLRARSTRRSPPPSKKSPSARASLCLPAIVSSSSPQRSSPSSTSTTRVSGGPTATAAPSYTP